MADTAPLSDPSPAIDLVSDNEEEESAGSKRPKSEPEASEPSPKKPCDLDLRNAFKKSLQLNQYLLQIIHEEGHLIHYSDFLNPWFKHMGLPLMDDE